MTQPEYTSEVNFRLCKSVFATLAAQGIISQESKYLYVHLIIDNLYFSNFCLNREKYVRPRL